MSIDSLIEIINGSTQHRFLYHFTDEANFLSIAQKGLVSKARMREEGWWPLATGGNQLSHDLDTVRGIDAYISLCFTQNHPMKYVAQVDGRLPNSRYLKIKPEALRIPGAQIAFGIANATDTVILPLTEALSHLDTEVIYRRTNWSDPSVQQRLRVAEKFEILIPHNIPRNLIEGII
jgi:hypothetical protein